MSVRVRLLGQLLNRVTQPIEDVTDHAAHRAKRLALQRSVIGGWVFGRPDRRVTVEELDVTPAGRTLPALVYRPPAAGDAPRPLVVNFHGGGWVQGNTEQSGWLASRVAARTGAVVISPSYRLAPEHPFPAAVDDAWDALRWIVDHADALGVDGDRVAVMGDSAGGNLAAVTALTSRDEGEPRLRAQVLIYPAVEMYEKFASELRMPNAPVLTSANMRTFVQLYLQDAYGTDDWRASPLRATKHEDLPPTFILTAEFDPLLDNGSRYREALQRAGVRVHYRMYADAIHGFVSLPGLVGRQARLALDDITDFLAEQFAPSAA